MLTNRYRLVVAAVLFCSALSACSHPEYDKAQALAVQKTAGLRITCNEGKDCSFKWARALQWVSEHAAFKLRIATDSIITTEGPLDIPGSTTESSISVNRIPLGDGNDEITFRSGCANEFGCVPTREMLLAGFADFVNSAPVASTTNPAQRERFGIHYVVMDPAGIAAIHLSSDHGLMVIVVDPGTPAASAGIQKADVLLSLAGHRLAALSDMPQALAAIPAGSIATAHIWRGGTEMDVQVQF